MFHHFTDHYHPKGQGAINASQFESILKYYIKNFNLLSANDWHRKALEKKLLSIDCCITFDDTLLCQYDVAIPILKKFNLKAYWFISTSLLEGNGGELEIYRYFRTLYFKNIHDFYSEFEDNIRHSPYFELYKKNILLMNKNYLSEFPFYSDEDKKFRFTRDQILEGDKYFELMNLMIEKRGISLLDLRRKLWMTNEMIKELFLDEHKIGLHSHSHPTKLASLSIHDQKSEYQVNKIKLEKIIGKDIDSMSHPCNSYDSHTLKILRELNIKIGFCSNMSKSYSNELEFPREDHANICNKLGLWNE